MSKLSFDNGLQTATQWVLSCYHRVLSNRRRHKQKRQIMQCLLELHQKASKHALKYGQFESERQYEVVMRRAREYYRQCTLTELKFLDQTYVTYFRSIPDDHVLPKELREQHNKSQCKKTHG